MFPKDQIADAVPLAAAGARGDGKLHISQVKSGGAALHSARDAKILHTMTRVLYSAARARGARRAEVRRSHRRVPSQGLDLELHEIACKQNGERDKCREQSEKAAEKERKRKKKKMSIRREEAL